LTTLSLIEAAAGAARALAPLPGSDTPAPEAGTITGLAWSPDGTRIAFTQRHAELDPAVDGLWLAAVDGGELTRLLDWPALDALFRGAYPAVALDRSGPLAWSPDGARLMVWAAT
jgi:Tol biopolymer transport system component